MGANLLLVRPTEKECAGTIATDDDALLVASHPGNLRLEPCLLAVVSVLLSLFLALTGASGVQAQNVSCSPSQTVTSIWYIQLDIDAGTCINSPTAPSAPLNGFQIAMQANATDLQIGGFIFENGTSTPVSSASWLTSNYSGMRIDNVLQVIFLDTISLSSITNTLTINGDTYGIFFNGVQKMDGVQQAFFNSVILTGLVVQQSPKANSADRTKTANHLLSTFNQVGAGLIGDSGLSDGMLDANAAITGPALAPGPIGSNRLSSNDFSGRASYSPPSPKNFGFSVDTRQMRIARRSHAGPDGIEAPRSQWSAWAKGQYVDVNDESGNSDRDGHLWWVTSGLSYAYSERTTIGGFVRARQGEVDSKALHATLDSDFVGGGLFLATTLRNGLRIVAAGLIEDGDHDIVVSGDAARFDTDQVTLEARLDKRFGRGRHWIEPALSVLYTDMARESYRDTAGTIVGASDVRLGRLAFGPTVGTTVTRGTTTFKPFARVKGIWDFIHEDDFTLSTGALVSSADSAIAMGGGVEVEFRRGVVFKASGDWVNFDTDLNSLAVQAGLGVPFAALGPGGLAAAGRVSFDLEARKDAASATARVRIPLGGDATAIR